MDHEADAAAIRQLRDRITALAAENAALRAELAAIPDWLRREAADYHSRREPVETQRMYRLGQHDALLLASDALERGDHRATPAGGE